jgi:hypothetical protein
MEYLRFELEIDLEAKDRPLLPFATVDRSASVGMQTRATSIPIENVRDHEFVASS